jgi:hypothetical protein
MTFEEWQESEEIKVSPLYWLNIDAPKDYPIHIECRMRWAWEESR